MSNDAVTVFFSYSHRDETLRDELAKHLEILKWNGVIADWHDRKILPGDEWDREIRENLASAQIILLLVSSDFIASRYCRDVEITKAMARHEAGEARVIPVILRRCLWHVTPFGKLQALPKNGTPVMDVSTWPTWDDAFFNIAEGIHKVAIYFTEKTENFHTQATVTPTDAVNFREAIVGIRQVNDSIKRARAQYRSRIKEYLVDHELTVFQEVRLDLFRTELKWLPEVDAQRILTEELAKIEQNRESYRAALSRFIEAGHDPVEAMVQRELSQIRQTLKLNDAEVTEIEGPLLKAAEYKFEVLRSQYGIDHTKLRDLLKAGEWKAADKATYEVMIQAVGKRPSDYFSKDDLLNFPCKDLLAIDHLWMNYSKGRFGLSTQRKIYVECGGTLSGEYPDDTIWREFGDRVGWRVNGKWMNHSTFTFSISAPYGHLPGVSDAFLIECGAHHFFYWFSFLSSRLVKCKL